MVFKFEACGHRAVVNSTCRYSPTTTARRVFGYAGLQAWNSLLTT